MSDPWTLDLATSNLKRQVDITYLYILNTSYLLLWATYISHIEFNPFRAIFAYCQRQTSSALTYTLTRTELIVL